MFFTCFFAQLTQKAGSSGLIKVTDKAPTDVTGARTVRVSSNRTGTCVVRLRSRLEFLEAFQWRFRRSKKSSRLAKGCACQGYGCGLAWENEV